MKFAANYTVPAARDKVFEMITAPTVLQRCIPGCEKMERTSEDNYDAHLKIGIAGLKGGYLGKVQLQDKRPPESYTLLMEGKGGPGFVKGTGHIQLKENNGATEIRCDAEVQVDEDTDKGDVVECSDCGTQLEVVGLDPIELDVAVEEEEEDWTE